MTSLEDEPPVLFRSFSIIAAAAFLAGSKNERNHAVAALCLALGSSPGLSYVIDQPLVAFRGKRILRLSDDALSISDDVFLVNLRS